MVWCVVSGFGEAKVNESEKVPETESSSKEDEEQPQQQGNSFMDFWRNT